MTRSPGDYIKHWNWSLMSTAGRQQARLELQLYPGDEYVGSLEPESMQVLTYVKFSKATVEIKTSCVPWHSPSGRYPVLQRGPKTVISRAEDIITYLKEQGFNTDVHLKDHQQAETVAYTALLNDRLLPAILYSRWLDSQNYVEVIRGWYGGKLYFPLSIIVPSWRHRAIHQQLMRDTPADHTPEQRGMELMAKAEECISSLSARLGEDDYFFGNNPSSLDALVFGYLEVVLQCPLPSSNSLHSRLHSSVNLVRFCERIRRDCFPDMKLRSAHTATSRQSSRGSGSLWRDPTLWVSVGLALLLLGAQGARVGLFGRLSNWVHFRQEQQDKEDYGS